MSLYNALFGMNKIAPLLLKMLDIDQGDGNYDSGRFRDIYLNEDGSKIILFTRNGGGNREQYQETLDRLAEHPNYLTDYDDDFDCTYAYIEFEVPAEHAEVAKQLATGEKPATVSEKFENVISDLQSGNQTEETARMDEVGRAIFQKIADGEHIIEV